ncbi:hexokinase type 2 isoform X2 [Anoplophora glabripennis]|uniref:hexokinase type 2 isoform X2 n=1 Tax=Anoplophora glabripennis TaxID=217634 RepID=UPI0008747C40|nr:hexokinase type 2 isoform X2 [Anoplophora glabripennis]
MRIKRICDSVNVFGRIETDRLDEEDVDETIDYHLSNEIRDKCRELVLDNDKLRKIMEIFLDNVHRGLKRETHADSIVKCFPTYVQDLPNGTETGKFLALDLGGTNFRVLLIELSGEHFEMKSKIFAIPQHIMLGSGEQLFDHIAECLAIFVKEEQVADQRLPLGFTFSFPLAQKGLTKGILERWTKGFNCSNVVGNDVVQMLNEAIDRRGDFSISVMAILNDSTGTLMSCAWLNPRCRIGVIAGTGSNACYVERQENAEMWDDVDMGSGKVSINLEWGAFGDDGALDFVRCEYDEDVDKNSINPGKQKHEKMISGMYMGELVRLALERFTKEGLLFGGKGSDMLFERGRFYTKYVSEIESDPPGVFNNLREICEELGLKHASEQDYINIRYICECISRRSAHLVSAGLATLLNKIGEKKVTIGIDGSVYRFHPHFHNLMMEKIKELCDPSIEFDLMLSEDGSGRGAALVAAVAARLYNQNSRT